MNEEELRDLYRDREALVGDAAGRLLPGVRARRRRRRIRTAIGYGVTALAVVAVVAGVTVAVNRGTRVTPPPPAGTPHVIAPPTGTRFESSLGMQIAVPANWVVNDTGCHQTDAPSVNRGQGSTLMCYTPTPPRKEFATIAMSATPFFGGGLEGADQLPATPATVDGVAVRRAAGRIPGGMYAGWLAVPGRDVSLVVRARTAATVAAILDSVRLRDVDGNGCGVRPLDFRPTWHGDTFVDPRPASVSVCYYGGFTGQAQSPLQVGTSRTGDRADALAAALNAAAPGRNPDQPESACLRSAYPAHIDALIQVYSADGAVGRVAATWQVCTGIGMDNGGAHRKLTNDLIRTIMDGTGSGYMVFGPGR